ncbi:MAG: hypothetical protein ACLQU2_32515 [Candidatus Binataceae bacterium]
MYRGAPFRNPRAVGRLLVAALGICALLPAVPVCAADSIEGQVLGAGMPIAKSTVTLWSASADAPSSWLRLKPAVTVDLR